jgi:erythromycin esterase-like protein
MTEKVLAELEHWKDQAASWQDKFGKMVEIRDKFAAQLREVEQERDALREQLAHWKEQANLRY